MSTENVCIYIYIFVKGKVYKEKSCHSEKNTLMFYVPGQQQFYLLCKRHCINIPEQFYKVVLNNNDAQQQRDTVVNINNKHQYRRTLPK